MVRLPLGFYLRWIVSKEIGSGLRYTDNPGEKERICDSSDHLSSSKRNFTRYSSIFIALLPF